MSKIDDTKMLRFDKPRNAGGKPMTNIDDTRDEGERCQSCWQRYTMIYRIPDNIWEQIRPNKDDPYWGGGLLCPRCADRLAREAGYMLYWEPSVGDWRVNKLPVDDARRELAEITEKTAWHTELPADRVKQSLYDHGGGRTYLEWIEDGREQRRLVFDTFRNHADAHLYRHAPDLLSIATTLTQRVTELEKDMHSLLKRHVTRQHEPKCECDLCWERRKITGRLFNYSLPEETQS